MRKHRTKKCQFLWQSLRLCFTLFAYFFARKESKKNQRHFVPDFFPPRPIKRSCATAHEARSVFDVE